MQFKCKKNVNSRNQGLFLWGRPLLGATTPGQSRPGSDGNNGVLCISQSSSITGTSPSDCLVSYTGHSLWGSYPSAKKQSVYFTAQADRPICNHQTNIYIYCHPQLFSVARYVGRLKLWSKPAHIYIHIYIYIYIYIVFFLLRLK